jgi:hypothetical protein
VALPVTVTPTADAAAAAQVFKFKAPPRPLRPPGPGMDPGPAGPGVRRKMGARPPGRVATINHGGGISDRDSDRRHDTVMVGLDLPRRWQGTRRIAGAGRADLDNLKDAVTPRAQALPRPARAPARAAPEPGLTGSLPLLGA